MSSKHIQLCVAFVALIVGATSITSASAKVRITERTKFYTVTGKTGKQVFRSIRRKGPKPNGIGHSIATTRTQIRVKNIKTAIRGRRCVVTNADVFVNLTYTLPRWRGSRNASAKVRRNWNSFYDKVKRHEDTHGRISREYARSLEKKIKKLSGRVSRGCADFGSRSRRAIRLLQERYVSRHRSFDRREGRASSRVRRLQKALALSR